MVSEIKREKKINIFITDSRKRYERTYSSTSLCLESGRIHIFFVGYVKFILDTLALANI